MAKTIITTILLAILPISELRGGIPYGFFNGIPMVWTFLICVICNALVAPIGFLFLNTLHKLFMKWSFYERIFNKTVEKARKKVESKVQKYGIIGLMIFVAVPLPVTGAWTGVLGAWILNLDKKKSCLAIALGVLISGIVVSAIVYAGVGINSIFVKTI